MAYFSCNNALAPVQVSRKRFWARFEKARAQIEFFFAIANPTLFAAHDDIKTPFGACNALLDNMIADFHNRFPNRRDIRMRGKHKRRALQMLLSGKQYS